MSALPHFRCLSYNLNSTSSYVTTPSGVARKDNIIRNITTLARTNDILLLQETKLKINDRRALKGVPGLARWGFFYSNGDGQGGVLTIISPRILANYTATEVSIPGARGHVLIVVLTPKRVGLLPLQVINIYLPSDTRRITLLKLIRSNVDSVIHTVMGGGL